MTSSINFHSIKIDYTVSWCECDQCFTIENLWIGDEDPAALFKESVYDQIYDLVIIDAEKKAKALKDEAWLESALQDLDFSNINC